MFTNKERAPFRAEVQNSAEIPQKNATGGENREFGGNLLYKLFVMLVCRR